MESARSFTLRVHSPHRIIIVERIRREEAIEAKVQDKIYILELRSNTTISIPRSSIKVHLTPTLTLTTTTHSASSKLSLDFGWWFSHVVSHRNLGRPQYFNIYFHMRCWEIVFQSCATPLGCRAIRRLIKCEAICIYMYNETLESCYHFATFPNSECKSSRFEWICGIFIFPNMCGLRMDKDNIYIYAARLFGTGNRSGRVTSSFICAIICAGI